MEKLNLDGLIEKVRRDLNGKASDKQVSKAVTELAVKYHDAKVKLFIPIFIHREAVKQLNANIDLASQNNGNN